MARSPRTKPDPSLLAIERALVRIRRSMSKRTLGKLALANVGADHALDLGLLEVVDAVEEGPESAERGISVGVVAERLGIDPSRASRVVAAAIGAGYIARVASQADGRRVELALTAKGQALCDVMHRTRQAQFAERMRDWSARERRDFAELLSRFTA